MEYRPTPKQLIVGPVTHIAGGIWDADNFHVADIRGWGRLQYFENGDDLQDKIAEWVVSAINEKLKTDPI